MSTILGWKYYNGKLSTTEITAKPSWVHRNIAIHGRTFTLCENYIIMVSISKIIHEKTFVVDCTIAKTVIVFPLESFAVYGDRLFLKRKDFTF